MWKINEPLKRPPSIYASIYKLIWSFKSPGLKARWRVSHAFPGYITSRTSWFLTPPCPLRAITHPYWQWDGGKCVSLYCGFHWWSCKCCFSYYKVDPTHPDALHDIAECNILAEKQTLKCYHKIISLVLGLLYLFCFPGHFFPSLTHLRVWLAPSPCPSLRTYTISMTAASENFSRRLPASDSRAQGTLPPSASGGPPVLSLTPYSLLRQPPPPTLPLLPTTSFSSSTSAPYSLLQPSQSAEAGAGTSITLGIPLA